MRLFDVDGCQKCVLLFPGQLHCDKMTLFDDSGCQICVLNCDFFVITYNHLFVRDFVPSAFAFLMNGEPEIVKIFLLKTLHLQAWEKQID